MRDGSYPCPNLGGIGSYWNVDRYKKPWITESRQKDRTRELGPVHNQSQVNYNELVLKPLFVNRAQDNQQPYC